MTNRHDISLSTAIIIVIAGLVVLDVAALVGAGHLQSKSLLYEREEHDGRLLTGALRAAIEAELQDGVDAELHVARVIERVGREAKLRGLLLRRADGSVLARGGSGAALLADPAFSDPAALARGEILTTTDRARQALSFATLVGRSTAGLLLTFERDATPALAAHIRHTWSRAAGALVLTSVLAIVLYGLLRRMVIRPAAQLVAQANLLGVGDLSARSQLSPRQAGSVEMLRLARAFDAMAERLQHAEAQQRETLQSLRTGEARYRTMVENADDLICRFLPDGRLSFVNDACCRVSQRAREGLVGHRLCEAFAGFDEATEAQLLADLHREGAAQVDRPGGQAGGRRRWYQWTVRAVHEPDGRPLEYQAVGRDITAHKRAEQDLAQENVALEERVRDRTGELEAALRELESFSYAISHDLRAPLRSIDGFSRILVENADGGSAGRPEELLGRIRQQAQQMGRLIDDLLTLARVSQADMNRDRVDLTALGWDCLDALRRADPQRRVELQVHPGMAASADEPLLRVALARLLDNAWKFTRGVEAPRIEVGVTQRLSQHVAFVRDNGVGFDMAYVERLFTRLRRLHSTREMSGRGMGLAIVQRIVERHGGRIWAEGRPGQGATFFFTLAGT
jgi:PAS domain S-box-containing protein